MKAERDPNAPPPESLDWEVSDKIATWIVSEGGTVALGKLTSVFPGVKKVQLEEQFVVTPGAKDAGNATVSCIA